MIYGFNNYNDALNAKVLAQFYGQNPMMQGMNALAPLDDPGFNNDFRYHRVGIYIVRVTEEVTAAEWDSANSYWKAGTGLVEVQGIYSEPDPPPPVPINRIGARKYYLDTEGVVDGEVLVKRAYNASEDVYEVTTDDDQAEFHLALEDAYGRLWMLSGGGGGAAFIGRVVVNDIQPQSGGIIERIDQYDFPSGDNINVYNPHDVKFLQANTDPDTGHEADRLIAWKVKGWDLPLVYPFMLTACTDLSPTFDPELV